MGCDIHLYAEKKADGKWINAQDVSIEYEDDPIPNVPYEQRIYTGGNYSLFGILANVRNGVGFAGIDTGNALVPVANQRGLPEDISSEIQAISDQWGCDGHSHSWLTLQELLSYDWTQTATKRGYVDIITYFQWRGYREEKMESPDEWCGSVHGPSIQNLTRKQADDALNEMPTLPTWQSRIDWINKNIPNSYVAVEWNVPYYKLCKEFLSEAIPKLLRLGKPEDVRIIFWFDN